MVKTVSKLLHKTEAGKRFLAGAVALLLVITTLLGDINIAYAKAANDIIPVGGNILDEENASAEKDAVINEAFGDEGVKDDTVDAELSKTEILNDEISNAEELPNDNISSNAPDGKALTDEMSADSRNEAEIENADEDNRPENMPAISITETVDDYEISLECIEGTFAEGTTVEIIKIEDEEKEEVDQLVEDAITDGADEDVDIVKIVTFDVTFYDKDGNVVEPADENSVSIKIIPSDEDKTELENTDVLDNQELSCSVFHIEDDENVEEIECEITDPVEEITFEAESFSAYSIVWYIKGDDGKPHITTTDKGPQEIGGYIRSTHTFIDFMLPLEFTNEGSPVDVSLRPEEFIFEIYGRDTTGGEGIDHEEVLICEVTVPYEYYNNAAKTVRLKQSGKTKTEIPIYVVRGTQAQGQGGSGDHIIDGFEYTVKFVGTGENSIYTVKKDTTPIDITTIPNQAEWNGNGNQTLSAERQSLEPKKFYVSWVDNRNKAGKRPYSTIDNFTDEAAKTEFKNSITLYRQVGSDPIELVTDEMLPTTLAQAGPIVGRKDGKSISDWEITYNNLPTVSNGKSIKYFITVDETNPSFDWYSPVMPEDVKVTDSTGNERQALSSDKTAKYIYSEDFTATVKWYDEDDRHEIRLSELELVKELLITDDKDKTIFDGLGLAAMPSNIKITKNGNDWELKVGPLPMYDEQGTERSYKLVLRDGVIKKDGTDGIKYEYSVDYSNVPKTTAHENCLSGGKVILVIDRPLDSFDVVKQWADDENYESRKEAVESGVRFLLWRYPETKQDGTPGTPADRAAVFNPDTHIQYSYVFTMNDDNVTTLDTDGVTRIVKDSTDITLREFGVTDDHPVDMFDQNGYKYVYFATEVISKPGYITVYDNATEFKKYNEYGVMNGGHMINVRQEKMKMEGIVKWNVPSVNDYTKTTVTIELQRLKDGIWETLPNDGDKVYTKTLSGFAITNPKKSYVFPEVDRYDATGKEIQYRVIQTNVNYSGTDLPDAPITYTIVPDTDGKNFISKEFEMNGKKYMAVAAPTQGSDDSYTIENRLAGDKELVLTKIWKDSGSDVKGFGKSGCLPYPNIAIKVFQHGVSTNYLKPYMTITTTGTKKAESDPDWTSFETLGVEDVVKKTVPCIISYPGDSSKPDEDGVIIVTTDSDGRAVKWEFKKKKETEESEEILDNISLPAFNEHGNAYSYTVEESINYTAKDKEGLTDGVYTEYEYERIGNELDADVTNTYATGGGGYRTVIFQKEWVDGTDIPQEKPIRMAIVRVKADGEFYYNGDEIDLRDNFGETHIVTLTENNNWYGQLGFRPGEEREIELEGGGTTTKTRFDKVSLTDGRYMYTAIELDMALSGKDDFLRKVKYDVSSTATAIRSAIEDDSGTSSDLFYGSIDESIYGKIDSFLDAQHEENHLPGYDVTLRSGEATVISSSKYVVVNKRKGIVNVKFNKTWQDGNNSEGTRNGTYRVYLYQNGKKVLNPDDITDPSVIDPEKETTIKNFSGSDFKGSPAKQIYAGTVADADNTISFSFDNLPQYDDDGNLYHYSVKEFLVKGDKELEIALTDTKDSSKTGYVVTDHTEETHFSDPDKILERTDTYRYTNTITGEKTGGAKFYVLWHDQTSYDKGNRPDVNYVLYYKVKGSAEAPQIYKGEYKAEWHPMFDPDSPADGPMLDSDDTTKASRYYQYINFTKLPLANDEGRPYEYYAVPSLNNPGEHYDEEYYNTCKVEVATKDGTPVRTTAGKYHYDIAETPAPVGGTSMLPENGLVRYTIDENIEVSGTKHWRLNDNKEHAPAELPDAEIYLWCESDHDKTNSKDGGTSKATTHLNTDKNGYIFPGTYPKYDKYGQTYTYSVTEKIFLHSGTEPYTYSIPNYVMSFRPDTNGITNIYNEDEAKRNLRKFTVTKDWTGLDSSISKKPVAVFALYRMEIPLDSTYYESTPVLEGTVLNANPKKPAYTFAKGKFTAYKGGDTTTGIEKLGEKSVAYGAENSSVVWENMPIFAPSGCVYLYFVEELNKQGIDSFDYDVITKASGSRPAVKNISDVDVTSEKSNILISDPTKGIKAVLFSNHGLDASVGENNEANWQEAGYQNSYKNEKFGKIVGYKTWNDGLFSDKVRPEIVGESCPEVKLTLTRRAATQTGYGNQIATETIDSSKYETKWYQDSPDNVWRFEITPVNTDEEFKLYATNGQPYTYTVVETITGNTLANYTITRSSVTGTKAHVTVDTMTLPLSLSLQNTLKGQVKVFKKWDDALDEHGLRSGHVNVVLQYRLVPNTYGVGVYNEDTPPVEAQWKIYAPEASVAADYKTAKDEYRLIYDNHWGQTVNKLPVISRDGNYRYEYRLLETEFYDVAINGYRYPVNIDNLSSVPNGGLCTDASTEGERQSLYGNSTSPDEKYHNKSYEIVEGNYHVNNSAIASLAKNTSGVSSMELRVDNRLSQKTSLKIEKRWNGVNVEDEKVAPVDYYGVLPSSITFNIEYKEDNPDAEWRPLIDGSGKQVTVKVDKSTEDNSFVHTVNNLPLRSEGDEFIYRAIEQTNNLGRFDEQPQYIHDPAIIEGDREICHTVVTNTLPYRDITIKKKWNAEEDLRTPVTIELWSDNFTNSVSEDTFSKVGVEKTLSAEVGWEATYNNLPVYNTKHEKINYYVKESQVNSVAFNANDYDVYFFDQVSKADDEEVYEEVEHRYHANANIAPIPENAYKMFVVNTPKRSLRVSKKWEDEKNRQGLRANVNVTLSNESGFSVTKPTQAFTTGETSSVTWNYLPLYEKPDANFVKGSMAHMNKVNYTITEATTLRTKGYEAPEYSFNNKSAISDSGYIVNLSSNNSDNVATITNTYHPPKIKFTATKEWDDENNRHFTRPVQKGIYLTLYYSTDNKTWNKVTNLASYKEGNYPDDTGVYTTSPVTQHVTNNDTNTWGTPVWEGLPTKKSKIAIYYKAFETDKDGNRGVTPGYTPTYAPVSINVSSKKAGDTVSQVVTNKIIPTNVRITKVWNDTYDVSDRPDAVTFVLEYRCGATDSWKVYKNPDGTVLKTTLTEANHKSGSKHIWEAVVEDLPSKNSEGSDYEYRVKEVSITYGGNEVSDYRISAETVSDATFSYVGGAWKSESTIGAYESKVDTESVSSGGYKATATNTPIIGNLTVTKKWDDESNRDNLRPHEIKLQLYRKQDEAAPKPYGDAVVVGLGKSGTVVSPSGNEWTYTFKNLPVYNNDAYEHTEENRSVFYVKEVNSEYGYDVTYTPENGQTTVNYDAADNILKHNSDGTYSTSEVITNKHTPVRIKITATKEWKDEDTHYGDRPEKLKFKLQYRVGEADPWKDVQHAASKSALDDTGMLVETTDAVEKTLAKETNAVSGIKEKIWDKDKDGKAVVWENLPAYVKGGKKVEYCIIESDSEDTPADKTISGHYKVVYTHCAYESDEGTNYSLKVTNIQKGMGGILTVEKKWDPEEKDDIAKDDKIIRKITCHFEQKSPGSSVWSSPEWGEFELTHDNDWQYTTIAPISTTYIYKVVEDTIVYDDGSTVSKNGNKIGSFVWSVDPTETPANDTTDVQHTVTLTNEVPNNSITVTKIWDDENNRDGVRPHSIAVALYRDGVQVGEKKYLFPASDSVTESTWNTDEYGNTVKWENLPVYKNGTNEKSVYTVEEELEDKFTGVYEKTSYKIDGVEIFDPVNKTVDSTRNGITFELDGPKNVKVSITNQHKTNKKTIKASKIWKDENNKYATRPSETYLMLLYKLEGKTDWQPVEQYPVADATEAQISGGKLYKDHKVYTTSPVIQKIQGDNGDKWENKAEWKNLSTRGVDDAGASPVYNKEVSYMVIEVPRSDYNFRTDTENPKDNPKSIAPAGYKVSEPKILDEGHDKTIVEFTDVTNTLITTDLEVEKAWKDSDNQFNTRPENIRVQLERKLEKDLANSSEKWNLVEKEGAPITKEICATDNWKASFTGLPLYDDEGHEYVYRVVETDLIYDRNVHIDSSSESDDGRTIEAKLGNYLSKMETKYVEDEHKFMALITNELGGDSTKLIVRKNWKDENDRDRVRPDSVTVNLKRDGIIVDTQTITEDTEPTWTQKWNNLPLYKNGYSGTSGEKSSYIVTEDAVDKYVTTISDITPLSTNLYEYTITNKHVPDKAVITADKKWLDSKNIYSTRPNEIYLRLMYKYDVESDAEYRPVVNYPKTTFDANGKMYASEGVFTTSKVTQMLTGSDVETWGTARWENLPLKATPDITEHEPMTVIYKVIEVPAEDSTVNVSHGYTGYEVIDESIDGDSLDIENDNKLEVTNKLITAELNITKVFEDSENKFVSRPDSIEVQVLRRLKPSDDDSEWKPVKVGGLLDKDLFVTLTKADSYCKKLTDIPKYDKDGNEYEYTCLEKYLIFGDNKIPLDKSNVTASHTISGDETVIKNKLVTTSLTVTKEWDDNSNARGARPLRIVFSLERKKTMDLVSQIISKLTELITGEDGYEPFKMLVDGNEVPAEIIIEGPEFDEYILEGLPAYSEDGYPYSYRAIETKLVYPGREVLVSSGTSLYEKPKYQFDVIESGEDAKRNTAYKYEEKVVNKIIPIIYNPVKPDDSEPKKPEPVVPEPTIPKYEILEDGDPEELPEKVTEKIYELIDLPDSDISNEEVAKLYRDLVRILNEDPAFIDKLDEETADIVIRFLRSGVLGRRRSRLPKTGGVVGSVMTLLFASTLIGLGVVIRPEEESRKKGSNKKNSKKKKKAKK